MVSIRTPTKTWVAREGKVYLGRGIAQDTAKTLSGVFSLDTNTAQIERACKNVTITPPETSWEKQDLLGKDSNSFQNQLLDEKPVGLATFTGTLIVGEDEVIEDLVVSGTVTSPGGYTRYQVGKAGKSTVNLAVTLNTNDSANMATFAFFEAEVTKWGDVRVSGPDAHWEQDITLICLAKNFYYEFKD